MNDHETEDILIKLKDKLDDYQNLFEAQILVESFGINSDEIYETICEIKNDILRLAKAL